MNIYVLCEKICTFLIVLNFKIFYLIKFVGFEFKSRDKWLTGRKAEIYIEWYLEKSQGILKASVHINSRPLRGK